MPISARRPSLALLAALALSSSPAHATKADPREEVLLQRELARSFKGYEAPFFASYRLTDLRHLELSCRYGAIFGDRERRDSDLFVDVRVGNYDLDLLPARRERGGHRRPR